MIWSIDGLQWTIPCAITRVANIMSSEISGYMMDKAYFNDVMGTYMQYDITLAVPLGQEDEYYQIYEKLTAPVAGHMFVMPYNASTVQFFGRVEKISDQWVYRDVNNNWWKGVSFSCVGSTPTKYATAEGMTYAGLSPFPPVASADIGDTYVMEETGWQKVVYVDADEEYY